MGNTVLVTGGSAGIGREIVRRFARDGHDVWFTYRGGKERADALVAELAGHRVRAFQFDQGDWESQRRLLAALPGNPEILILNAAVGSATVAHLATEPHLQDQAMFQVNAVGTVWLAKAVVPGMVAANFGRVIVLGSVNGAVTHFPGFSLADGMSKAAVSFMTKQLAAELVATGITVVGVAPGATETPMFEASTLSRLDPEARRQFEAALPKGKLIDPAEIAEIVAFCCSPTGEVLHGAVLDASRGLGVAPGAFTAKNPYQ